MQQTLSQQLNQQQKLKTICNYIATKELIVKGIQNKIFFFYSEECKQLICFQSFSLNGQLKVIKVIEQDLKEVTFMNKNEQFINSNFRTLSLWKLDIQKNWNYYETIFEQESVATNFIIDIQNFGLSNQENLIVILKCNYPCFIYKDNNGNWVEKQILSTSFRYLHQYKFNELDNIILAYNYQQCQLIIFAKNESWRIAEVIEIKKDKPYCFIDKYQFALQENDQGFMTMWEINSISLKARKFSQISFQNYKKCSFEDLIFIKSKDLLVAVCNRVIYLIKRENSKDFRLSQIIKYTKDFYMLNFQNEEFLFFYSNSGCPNGFRKHDKIQVKMVYQN